MKLPAQADETPTSKESLADSLQTCRKLQEQLEYLTERCDKFERAKEAAVGKYTGAKLKNKMLHEKNLKLQSRIDELIELDEARAQQKFLQSDTEDEKGGRPAVGAIVQANPCWQRLQILLHHLLAGAYYCFRRWASVLLSRFSRWFCEELL